MNKNVINVSTCPITGDSDKFTYIDLGEMPLVNNLCDTRQESLECDKYKLAVQYFPKSKLSCLSENVDPTLLFSQYSYKSGVVKAYAEHCDEMFWFVDFYLELQPGDKVLDIGGNDGTLLETFLKTKPYISVLNIDASENIAKISRSKGIPTLNAFWGTETAKNLNVKFKLITSTNVFQHTPPIVDYVEAVAMKLDKFGIWCLEFPYWKSTMETKQYDQIYHEHVYYYLIEPLQTLFKKFGLRIIKILHIPIHGGSVRLLVSHEGDVGEAWQPCDSVQKIIEKEKELTSDYYIEWGKAIENHIKNCREFLIDQKKSGKKIVGFGAAAKGCVFLNSAKINHEILDAVIDDTDLKQRKYIPGTGIQIVGRDYLKNNQVDSILILAHNFKNIIIDGLKKDGYTGDFIVLFPEIKIL